MAWMDACGSMQSSKRHRLRPNKTRRRRRDDRDQKFR
jgi:hypothetical protein